MTRSILIPTDFSDNAWNAAVYALKLYADEECTFYFLHAYAMANINSRTYITANFVSTLEEDSLRQLTDLKEMVERSNINANHSFDIILCKDKLQQAIEKTIKKYKIDLIIMGTNGATKAKEIFFGSNTVHLIQKIKSCPVLVVPSDFEFVEPKQIAFPTDFNRFFGEELQPIKDLSELHDSKIRIVHITKTSNLSKLQNYNLCMLKVYLENNPHSFHWLPDYASMTKEINDFIKDFNINILAMINYEHSFIEAILNEPVVKKIGFSPAVPFLVIPGSI